MAYFATKNSHFFHHQKNFLGSEKIFFENFRFFCSNFFFGFWIFWRKNFFWFLHYFFEIFFKISKNFCGTFFEIFFDFLKFFFSMIFFFHENFLPQILLNSIVFKKKLPKDFIATNIFCDKICRIVLFSKRKLPQNFIVTNLFFSTIFLPQAELKVNSIVLKKKKIILLEWIVLF